MNLCMRWLVMKNGILTKLIIHSPRVRVLPDQNKLFFQIEILTGLHFVYASYFYYCDLQSYNTVYSVKYQCSTPKIKAVVFLQALSTFLPEHT